MRRPGHGPLRPWSPPPVTGVWMLSIIVVVVLAAHSFRLRRPYACGLWLWPFAHCRWPGSLHTNRLVSACKLGLAYTLPGPRHAAFVRKPHEFCVTFPPFSRRFPVRLSCGPRPFPPMRFPARFPHDSRSVSTRVDWMPAIMAFATTARFGWPELDSPTVRPVRPVSVNDLFRSGSADM